MRHKNGRAKAKPDPTVSCLKAAAWDSEFVPFSIRRCVYGKVKTVFTGICLGMCFELL
jgi:hypothetical protein